MSSHTQCPLLRADGGSLQCSSLPPRAQTREPSHNRNGAPYPGTEMGVGAVYHLSMCFLPLHSFAHFFLSHRIQLCTSPPGNCNKLHLHLYQGGCMYPLHSLFSFSPFRISRLPDTTLKRGSDAGEVVTLIHSLGQSRTALYITSFILRMNVIF